MKVRASDPNDLQDSTQRVGLFHHPVSWLSSLVGQPIMWLTLLSDHLMSHDQKQQSHKQHTQPGLSYWQWHSLNWEGRLVENTYQSNLILLKSIHLVPNKVGFASINVPWEDTWKMKKLAISSSKKNFLQKGLTQNSSNQSRYLNCADVKVSSGLYFQTRTVFHWKSLIHFKKSIFPNCAQCFWQPHSPTNSKSWPFAKERPANCRPVSSLRKQVLMTDFGSTFLQ